MGVRMFLDLDGCKGESDDDDFKGQIEVLGWRLGVSNSGGSAKGGGSTNGTASFTDVMILKYVDKASGTLFQSCASGKHFPKARLTCIKAAGTKKLQYLVIDFKQVLISGVDAGGDQGDERIGETVMLNFATVNAVYHPESKDGTAQGQVPFKWNVRGNSAKL
jgi:type VI secretion system secreted protein Hcp